MKNRKIFQIFIFVIGFSMCVYPVISSFIVQRYQKNTVATYEEILAECKDDTVKEELEGVQKYNAMLYQTQGIVIDDIKNEILNTDNYNSLLNISGNGIMGSIEIPKINVYLPIYHGTSEEVLESGIGHLEESSFPVGGENTRAVLTGHRGLPNSKLFTRLDEMELGDLFFISVLNKKLAYRVSDITVINPEDIDMLKIQGGRDLVTLVTCTPYGINTHRLLVTGEQVSYEIEDYNEIEKKLFSPREMLFACLPFLFLCIVIFRIIKKVCKKRTIS